LLAQRVAPGGRVVGLDADPPHAAVAAEFAAGQCLISVEIMTADARSTGLHSVVMSGLLFLTWPANWAICDCAVECRGPEVR
jgi:hypothetical protein